MQTKTAAGARGYWDGLRLSLLRFFEGPPIGRHGLFQGVVFTAFHLLEGGVTVAKDGVSAQARKGQWLVCHPGERFQDFSAEARILSIHLLVENPANAAVWTGGPVVALAHDTRLARCERRLRGTGVLRRLRESGKLNPQGVPATFPEMLQLHEAVAGFFAELMTKLEPLGLRYEPPVIRDSRVRDSRQRLATTSFQETFSRARLAAPLGLSPARLDRLWRDELGTTPAQYWNKRRLETACTLLQGEEHSIKEVAYETGFRHLSQFSAWFTHNMAEPPRAFRSRHERD